MHYRLKFAMRRGTLLGVVGFTAAICGACADTGHRPPPVRKSLPSRVSAPTSLRKAQLPDELTNVLAESIHAKLDCSDCHPASNHAGTTTSLDENEFSEARCDHCHPEQAADYETGVHALIERPYEARGAVCAQCHGDHDIYRVGDPRSRVAKRNVSSMCTACHESPEVAPRLRAGAVAAGAHYLESIHGRALIDKGLNVAPACTDCHGNAHTLQSTRNDQSAVSTSHIAETCGHCHEGVLEQFRTSIHFTARATGELKPPTCTTCHTAHDIEAADGKDFRMASDRLCGKCHNARRERYLDTYHGKAHTLGDERVAACYDCHGAHAINKSSDSRSTVSPTNRTQTCQKCHVNATRSFASFMPHADHTDRKNYPVLFWSFGAMTSLLLGTFAFFGVHTLLWFTRTLAHIAQNPAQFVEMRRTARAQTNVKLYLRFRPVDRLCHLLLIVSFLTLVATGMPLKFHESAWAKGIFALLGGVENAGKIHRLGALVTVAYFTIHLFSMLAVIRNHLSEFKDARGKFSLKLFLRFAFGPDSPVPNLQDLRDIHAHARWFIGKGPRPSFDRFTYWEKFDYMAVFWGVTIIGLSGLVMWFPTAASRLFPGWLINVAQLIHSDEALLAAGFIFTFHFFNSHFRPEKFPLDPVIFSGRVTETELRHDHGRQYARLKSENKLDALLTDSGEWSSWKWVFNPFGVFALLLGLVLVFAIFWGLVHGGG